MTDTSTSIGIIGMGMMGSRIATRLIESGFSAVHVYSRTPEKTLPLADAGAHACQSVQELVAHTDVVFTVVSDDAAVEEVYLGDQGIVAALEKRHIVADLSSVRPETSRKIADAVRAKGARALDVPISGSIKPLEQGAVMLLVGGDKSAHEECQTIFRAFSASSQYMGESGSGEAMKLVVNLVLATAMAGVAESVVLGEKLGLSRDQLLEVLGQTVAVPEGLKPKLKKIQTRDFAPEFKLSLMHKDVENALIAARDAHVPLLVAEAVERRFDAKGTFAEKDISSVYALIETRAKDAM